MEYRKVYDEIFKKESYNVHDSDIDRYHFVIDEVINNNFKTIIDISSGKGNLIKLLLNLNQDLKITSTDINKYHSFDVEFFEIDLSNNIANNENLKNKKYDILTCLDVLEHLEEKYIDGILKSFSLLSNRVLLNIANHSDIQNGVELHLTQKNFEWWNSKIENYFNIESIEVKYNNRLYVYNLKTK